MIASHFPTEPISELEVVDVEEQITIVRKVVDHPMNDMASVFDSTFTNLFPVLAPHGISPTGPALAIHHRMPTDTATFDVGMPVDKGLSESVVTEAGFTLENSVLPAGKIARISHIGSYDGLGDAWGKFMEAVVAAGEKPAFPFWEVYATEPSPDMDPATLRTDLVTLLES